MFDGPPTTALAFNPPDVDIMKNPPQKSNDSQNDAWVLFYYLVIGLYVGLATFGIFAIWYNHEPFLGINLAGDGHTRELFPTQDMGPRLRKILHDLYEEKKKGGRCSSLCCILKVCKHEKTSSVHNAEDEQRV